MLTISWLTQPLSIWSKEIKLGQIKKAFYIWHILTDSFWLVIHYSSRLSPGQSVPLLSPEPHDQVVFAGKLDVLAEIPRTLPGGTARTEIPTEGLGSISSFPGDHWAWKPGWHKNEQIYLLIAIRKGKEKCKILGSSPASEYEHIPVDRNFCYYFFPQLDQIYPAPDMNKIITS